MTVVYLDGIFALNALVDYLLLLTTAALGGTPMRRGRFCLCALLGGLYAVGTFIIPQLALPILRVLIGVIVALIAFLCEPRPWRLLALFFLLSGTLAGLMLALGLSTGSATGVMQRIYHADISWSILLGSASVFYVLLYLLFRQGARYSGGDMVDITIAVEGRSCRVRSLRDSGNTLRDPVLGRPVLVAEISATAPLWEKSILQVLSENCSPVEKMARLSGKGLHFTLLPYQSVGESGGLLLAVHSDYLQIGKRRIPRALVALTDTVIGNGCHALWGGQEKGGAVDAAMDQKEDSSIAAVDRAG